MLVVLLCTIGLLTLLFHEIGTERVFNLWRQISVRTWLTGVVLTCLFPVIAALRWRLMLGSLGHALALRRCLVVLLGIYPVNIVSPSGAGDLLRIVALRGQIPGMAVTGSLLVERSLDLLVLGLFALVGGLVLGRPEIIVAAVAVSGAVTSGLALSLLADRLPVRGALARKLEELAGALRHFSTRPWVLITAAGLTLCHWILALTLVTLMFWGIGANVSPVFVMAAMPVAILVGLIPVTLGGMGTRDAAVVVLFASTAEPSQALAAGLLYTFFVYWVLGFAGLPFITRSLGLATDKISSGSGSNG